MPETEADNANFERLLRETHRMIFQVAYSVVGNSADAEEVTQEAFLQAYRKFSSLRDPEKFRPWVARTCWRLALNHRRGTFRAMGRDGSWLTSRGPERDPEEQAAGRQFEDRLREQVARLPEKLRSALLLSAVQGMDAREAGAILGIPEGTVRSRLHLARRQLMRSLVL